MFDPNTVLGGSHRKVTQISKCSPQHRVSTLEHDRCGHDEPCLCPQAPPPFDVAEVLSPPPVMSTMPRPVEPMNTTQEDPRNLLLDATYIMAAQFSWFS